MVTLKNLLRPRAPGLTPRAVLEKLATIQMVDVQVPTTHGRWLTMPRHTQPEPEHRMLLATLALTLPPQPPPRITAGQVPRDEPGQAWGTGGIGVADFAGTGRLGVAVSRREPQTAYWFERVGDGEWVRHVIGQSEHLARTLGAAVLDIDGYAWLDIAFSRVLFRNPGCLADDPDVPWEAVEYDGGGRSDIGHADCDTGWGHVYWVQNLGGGKWVRHRLPDPPGDEETGSFHSPGVADFGGSGRLDIFGGVGVRSHRVPPGTGILSTPSSPSPPRRAVGSARCPCVRTRRSRRRSR